MDTDLHLTPQLPTAKMMESIQKLRIDPVTGTINGPYKDNIGVLDKHGHHVVSIWDGQKQKKVRRCHLIWWAATGEWPTTLIDHDNRIKNDDRIANLKARTHRQNMVNKIGSEGLLVGVKPSGNPSFPYACKIRSVYIGADLGIFKTEEEANARYSKASELIATAIHQALKELQNG